MYYRRHVAPLMAHHLRLSGMTGDADSEVLRRCYITTTHPSAEEIQALFTEILERANFVSLPAQDQPVMLPNLLAVGFVSFFSLHSFYFFLEFPPAPLTLCTAPRPTTPLPAFIPPERLSRRKKEPTWSGACRTTCPRRSNGRRRRRRPTIISVGRTGRETGRTKRPGLEPVDPPCDSTKGSQGDNDNDHDDADDDDASGTTVLHDFFYAPTGWKVQADCFPRRRPGPTRPGRSIC